MKEEKYVDKGVGNLFIKPLDGGKNSLVIRADTNLGEWDFSSREVLYFLAHSSHNEYVIKTNHLSRVRSSIS